MLGVAAYALVAIPLAIFLADGGLDRFATLGGALTAIGIVAGLIATTTVAIMLILAARVPLIDQTIGQDAATHLHARLGQATFQGLLAHAGFLLLGYAVTDGLNPIAEFAQLWDSRDFVLAVVGLGLLALVAVSSIIAARRKLPYEVWHAIHLVSYAAVIVSLPHQFSMGGLFEEGAAFWFWTGLFAVAGFCLINYRVLHPLITSATHRLVVRRIVVEAPDTISIELSGRRLEELAARGGQYFNWRFLAPGLWHTQHPFSLSAAPRAGASFPDPHGVASFPDPHGVASFPDPHSASRCPNAPQVATSFPSAPQRASSFPRASAFPSESFFPSAPDVATLRITVRALGRGTSRLVRRLRPGTRVLVEGPYGVFTNASRTRDHLVAVGIGIGITPIRALLEDADFKPGHATVILRARSESEFYLGREIDALCRAKGAHLVVLLGPRHRRIESWLPTQYAAHGYGLAELAPHLRDADLFVCGPQAAADLVIADARDAGMSAEQIHNERFSW